MSQGHQGHLERAQINRAAHRHFGNIGVLQTARIAHLFAQQEGREGRGIDGSPQTRPEPAHSPDMVLVSVGQDNGDNVVGIVFDIGRVGQDDLHARRGLITKGHPNIHHDPLARMGRAVTIEVEVHTDFVRPT